MARPGFAGMLARSAALRRRPRLLLTGLAALAFALALLRPALPWPTAIGSTLLVLDITQSMNVADARWQGRTVTRLAYTRELLRRVLQQLPCGHRAGLAVFTERKTMLLMAPVEVCAHGAALDDTLGGLDWRMAWAADSHLFYGSYSALDEIERRWPGSTLAFFTDGDQAPALMPGREPRYERHAGTPAGVLFGVGSETPQPVPRMDADGRITGYWSAEDTAGFASPGAPTLSVADMERMAQGEDVRNQAQRPEGAGASHLSLRQDAVLAAVARATGLQLRFATDPDTVVDTLLALPGTQTGSRRIELHGPLVVLAALALLASLLPAPRRRRPAPAPAEAAPTSLPQPTT